MRAYRKVGSAAVAVLALVVVQVALASTDVDPREQPLERPTAADTRRAKSSLVRLADLEQGFRVDKKLTRAPFIPRCGGYPGDRHDVTITGAADSSFKYTLNSVGSTTLFFKTEGDSDRYWQKTVRLKYIQCLAAGVLIGGVKPRITMAKQVKIRVIGGYYYKAVAYRMIARVSLPGKTPFYWIETAVFVKPGHSRSIGMIRMIYLDYLCECRANIASVVARRLFEEEHLRH